MLFYFLRVEYVSPVVNGCDFQLMFVLIESVLDVLFGFRVYFLEHVHANFVFAPNYFLLCEIVLFS